MTSQENDVSQTAGGERRFELQHRGCDEVCGSSSLHHLFLFFYVLMLSRVWSDQQNSECKIRPVITKTWAGKEQWWKKLECHNEKEY